MTAKNETTKAPTLPPLVPGGESCEAQGGFRGIPIGRVNDTLLGPKFALVLTVASAQSVWSGPR